MAYFGSVNKRINRLSFDGLYGFQRQTIFPSVTMIALVPLRKIANSVGTARSYHGPPDPTFSTVRYECVWSGPHGTFNERKEVEVEVVRPNYQSKQPQHKISLFFPYRRQSSFAE